MLLVTWKNNLHLVDLSNQNWSVIEDYSDFKIKVNGDDRSFDIIPKAQFKDTDPGIVKNALFMLLSKRAALEKGRRREGNDKPVVFNCMELIKFLEETVAIPEDATEEK